jgi:hypothetical protein
MTDQNEAPVGFDRTNEMFAWWGQSGAGKLDSQLKHFLVLTSDLQKACSESFGAQISALVGANERIGRSLLEFVQCRRPQDVIAAESSFMATVLEETSLQTKTCFELSRKMQERCVIMARESADEIRQRSTETAEHGVKIS